MKNNKAFGKEEIRSRELDFSVFRDKKNTILPVIIVFFLPVVLYLQTLSFGFTFFDDNEIILNNINILSSVRNAPRLFLLDAFLEKGTALYRPLQSFSYMIDAHLSGVNTAWMYHLTNVLLMGLSACLLFLFLRKFLIPVTWATFGALAYCAHPLFISSAAWIPARGDLLLVCFSLAAFLFLIEHLQKKKGVFLFLHWLAFSIALFCKETAAFLPFLFIIYYLVFSFEKRFEKKYLLNIALYAVSGIGWFWIRSAALGIISNQNDFGVTQFTANLRAIPEAVANFILPFPIAPIPSFSLLKTSIGVAAMALLMILFFINKERPKKETLFGIAWFLLLSFPTMFHRPEYLDYLHHRFYLPLIGLLLFIFFLLPRKRLEAMAVKKKTAATVGAVGLVAVLAVLTFVNSRAYSDPMVFWDSSIAQNPDNPLIYNNRGYVKESRGDSRGALADYTRALALDPDFALAYYNRGNVQGANGDLAAAVRDYDKAIALKPNDAQTYYNRGNTHRANGDLAAAVKDYDKAIQLNPYFAAAYNNRGSIFNDAGDQETALAYYNKALELDPVYAEAYFNRGLAYFLKGRLEEAAQNLDKTLELNPNYTNAYIVRGDVFQTRGALAEAIKDYDKAIELDPYQPHAYYSRGFAYKAKGLSKEAERDFQTYERLKKN